MNRWASCFGLVMLAFLSASCTQPAYEHSSYDFSSLPLEAPRLSQLVEGESVVITAVHTGCRNVRDEFRYDIIGPAPFRVRAHEKIEEDWLPLREFTLSKAESDLFDRLIAFYRHGDVDGIWCTSQDRVTIEWTTAAAPGVNEEFIDVTCQAEDSPAILPLWTLAKRAGAWGMKHN